MSSYSEDLAQKADIYLNACRYSTVTPEAQQGARDDLVAALARYNMSQEDNVIVVHPDATPSPEDDTTDALDKLLKALGEHVMWLSSIGYGYQAGRIGELANEVKVPR